MSEQLKNLTRGHMLVTVIVIEKVLPLVAQLILLAWLVWAGHWIWALILLFPAAIVFRIAGGLLAGVVARIFIARSAGSGKLDL